MSSIGELRDKPYRDWSSDDMKYLFELWESEAGSHGRTLARLSNENDKVRALEFKIREASRAIQSKTAEILVILKP